MENICLRVKNVSKQYPGTLALKNVDFELERGKVSVLVGENGAGKSTLMKIIAGIETPSSGDVYVEDEAVKFKNTKDAANKGIYIINQELSLFPNMTVMQNLFVGSEFTKNNIVVDSKLQTEKTVKVLERLKHPINPDEMVSSLRVGQQQIVEIARNVAKDNIKVLIMDEPTSSLSSSEVKVLFKVIEDLKAHGIAIVYISHRMEEIMQIGDNITVLKDGCIVANDAVKNISVEWIVKKMVGDDGISEAKPENNVGDEEVLSVKDIRLYRNGKYLLKDVSFNLYKGEVLGIYGLLGSGRTEIFEALMGICPPDSGVITINGREERIKDVAGQIKKGLALVPEDRQREGLVQTLNIRKNFTLSSLYNYIGKFALSHKKEIDACNVKIKELEVKVSDMELPILSLSGGNQQKVVIGKGLLTSPQIFLLDEPTRGIDVGAKAEVYNIIKKLSREGLSIIVISSELKEIIAIANRIIVLSNGMKSGELSSEEINEQALMERAIAYCLNVEEEGERKAAV